MMTRILTYLLRLLFWGYVTIIYSSCIHDKDLSKQNNENDVGVELHSNFYLYPFVKDEMANYGRIIIECTETLDNTLFSVVIPTLKYNKSWLFSLIQDDCKQSAFSSTWAAINGRPLSSLYYYDLEHLLAYDLPPDSKYFNKTLGSTDGTGNEVRFTFTTTVSPELEWMNSPTTIRKGWSKDYYRFFMKAGLRWINVREMLNYGNSIAFHDVEVNNLTEVDSIFKHFSIAQEHIITELQGRKCKILAEPNGNKSYLEAARLYETIVLSTAQNGSEVTDLYPFVEAASLYNKTLKRKFYTSHYDLAVEIEKEQTKPKEQQKAILVGIYNTDYSFAEFLLWLNNNYGKDGDDSVWFTSLEEYYEYLYYRLYSTISFVCEDNKLIIDVNLPKGENFYYPSISLLVKGLNSNNIVTITTSEDIKGFSWGKSEDGVLLNCNFRQHLLELCTFYVTRFQGNKSAITQKDALYFIQQLKESKYKTSLLEALQ